MPSLSVCSARCAVPLGHQFSRLPKMLQSDLQLNTEKFNWEFPQTSPINVATLSSIAAHSPVERAA